MYCINEIFIGRFVDQQLMYYSSKKKAAKALEDQYKLARAQDVLQYKKGELFFIHDAQLGWLTSYKIHKVNVK